MSYLMPIGALMTMNGIVLCLVRLICCRPRLCPWLCPSYYLKQSRVTPRNSACFSAASFAMSTITMVGIRYSSGIKVVDTSEVLHLEHSCEDDSRDKVNANESPTHENSCAATWTRTQSMSSFNQDDWLVCGDLIHYMLYEKSKNSFPFQAT